MPRSIPVFTFLFLTIDSLTDDPTLTRYNRKLIVNGGRFVKSRIVYRRYPHLNPCRMAFARNAPTPSSPASEPPPADSARPRTCIVPLAVCAVQAGPTPICRTGVVQPHCVVRAPGTRCNAPAIAASLCLTGGSGDPRSKFWRGRGE